MSSGNSAVATIRHTTKAALPTKALLHRADVFSPLVIRSPLLVALEYPLISHLTAPPKAVWFGSKHADVFHHPRLVSLSGKCRVPAEASALTYASETY